MKLFYAVLSSIFGFQIATAQLQRFEPTADLSGIEFGSQVAITPHDIFVSSISSVSSPGKVYRFNSSLEQLRSFYPSDALLDDAFANTLSVEKDFLSMGSPKHDMNGQNVGAVYI